MIVKGRMCFTDTVTVLCVTFRLSGDLSIQMVTALVLQLIQCSVKIPEKTDEVQDIPDTEDGGDESKPHVSFVCIIITEYTLSDLDQDIQLPVS